MVTSSSGSWRWRFRGHGRCVRAREVAARGSVWLAAVVLLAVTGYTTGCSSSAKNLDKFVGTWTFSAGMLNAVCPAPIGTIANDLAGDMMTLTKGTSSDLTSTLHTSYGDCTLQLSVDGTMASATPNQTCMLNVTVAGTAVATTLTVTSWLLTSGSSLGVDTLTTAAMGTATAVGQNCAVTVNGSASRSGGPADASPE